MSNVIRIRLTRLPSARDLEYLALRYLKVDGVYEVPLQLANDLIQSGIASPSDADDPLTGLIDALPLDCRDEDEG